MLHEFSLHLQVVIISKSWCPYCSKAKNAIKKYIPLNGPNCAVLEIENDPFCDAIQNYMKDKTKGRSVRNILILKFNFEFENF